MAITALVARPISSGYRHTNLILRCLPEPDLERILPHLECVELKAGRVLHYTNVTMEHAYFIEEGLVSVLGTTGPGRSVETWLIGNEGLVGVPVVLGQCISTHRRVVQLGGRALRIEANILRRLIDDRKVIRHLLLRYVEAVLLQASQLGACNAHHTLQERLARWLLMANDRYAGDVLPLTHDLLSRMLGVRRATITECIADLQEMGALCKSRSSIQITDRAKLKEVACICYSIIRRADRCLETFCESTTPNVTATI